MRNRLGQWRENDMVCERGLFKTDGVKSKEEDPNVWLHKMLH